MPRPPLKRRRPNNLASPKRAAKIESQSKAASLELERKLASKPLGKKPQDSDDSDNLVTKATGTRARRLTPRREVYASGAVGKGDKPGAYPTRAQTKQIMVDATNEILRTSRSSSQADSNASGQSTPVQPFPSTVGSISKEKSAIPTTVASPVRPIQPSASAVKKSSHTPLPETSILGVIKPRKRQPSILQLIDNNDSSSIHSDEEEEFLPDEISTPLESNLKHVTQPRRSILTSTLPESRKRKRESVLSFESERRSQELQRRMNASLVAEQTPSQRSLDLPAPSRTQSKALERQKAIEEDIMASPESSDSEAAPSRTKKTHTKPATKQKQPSAPTTEQLRDLMPSKQRISSRKRGARDDFEIPEDSTSSPVAEKADEEEHSAFLPNKARKATKGRRKEPLVKSSNAKVKAGNKAGMSQKPRSKGQSTNTIISTPSAHLRKPIPLSSTQSGNVEAKSPSQKQGTTSKVIDAVPSRRARKGEKQFGGSHLHSIDKENKPIQSHEDISDNAADEDTVEIQVGRGTTSIASSKAQNTNVEAKAWKNHWADIDDFSLAFEDASGSAQSSSPMAR